MVRMRLASGINQIFYPCVAVFDSLTIPCLIFAVGFTWV